MINGFGGRIEKNMKGFKRAFTIFLILLPGIGTFAYQWWLYRTPAGPVAVQVNGIESFQESSLRKALDVDAMPALKSVRYESVAEADAYLKDTGSGLDVKIGRDERYYPFQILAWHEAVNDVLGKIPVLVTATPLVGTSAVFDRRLLDGTLLTFNGTDLIWNNARLLKDTKTGSLWMPGLGYAVAGSLKGTQLIQIASVTERSWISIKTEGFAGDVLSRINTGYERDYTRDPHEGYATKADVIFPVEALDPRLPPKERVFGMRSGNFTKAWTEASLQSQIVLSDTVGDEPVVLLYDTDTGTMQAFKRYVDGNTLTFVLDDDLGIIDEKTKKSLKTFSLEPIALTPAYWFFWFAAYPHTELYVAR